MTTKEKLADIMLDLFGGGFSCDPRDLKSNRDRSPYRDIYSWEGVVTDPDRRKIQIVSWHTMGEIVKSKGAEIATITNRLAPIEILPLPSPDELSAIRERNAIIREQARQLQQELNPDEDDFIDF